MPSASATRRPRRRLSGSESRSGISTPSTFFGPSAATASAAETLESMPPESPSTMPRRRSRFSTCSRIASRDARDLGRRRQAPANRRRPAPPARIRNRLTRRDRVHCAAAISLAAISRRSILPFSDFGSAASNATSFRHHEILKVLGAVADHLFARELHAGSSATTALIACPSTGSGTPTTAASRTPGSA